MVDTQSIQVAIGDKQRQIAEYRAALADAIATGGNPYAVVGFQQRIATLEAAVITLQAELAAASATAAVPTASTGQVTKDDGTANSQNPATAATTVTTGANGRIDPANVESGTAAPVRTLQQTQGTSNYTAPNILPAEQAGPPAPSALPAEQAGPPAPPITSAGIGASNDDKAPLPKNATQTSIDNVFGSAGPTVPQPNVLDQYASYSYQASVYLMKPEAFDAMVKSKKKSIAGSQLLFQSGGAPVSGRNPYFTNDYYIDKIEIKSIMSGKGTGMSHNANLITMTVVEPNGITLIENLDKAVLGYLGTTGNPPKKKSTLSQLYLLVIKFYGYDASGKLIQAGINTTQGSTVTAPGAAFVEKYYPVLLNQINFKIANKLVEYELQCTAAQYQINTGQLRAAVPYNVELSGGTVQEALNGAAVVGATTTATTTGATTAASPASALAAANAQDAARDQENSSNPLPAPPIATAAPTPKLTVRQGLLAALNQYQRDQVGKGITYPDVYSIEFVASVGDAKIKRVGQDKKSNPTAAGGTAKQQLDPSATSTDNTTRILNITAGQPVVQVIDSILRNSTYIEDQQLFKILEDSGKQVPNGAAAANLAWYKISMQATPRQYDPLRNDYAYNIKYIVHPYKINDMISNWFPTPKYNGVHKQYNYWFTGLNTQILSYEQTYNALYSQVLTGGPPNPNSLTQSDVKMTPATRSGQSSQGSPGRANEVAANAADYLYSPADNQRCTVTIIGDPAWLQQGEITFGVDSKNFNFKGFLADGTINFDSQQILFEILFNTPSDYNLNTGLMDPNTPATTASATTPATTQPGVNRKSFIFYADECTSEFKQGKFTQTLKGIKLNYFGNQAQVAAASARPATGAATAGAGGAVGPGGETRALTSANPASSVPAAIPTSSPQVSAPVDSGSTVTPTAPVQPITSAGGTVVQYPPAPNTAVSPVVSEAPPQPRPATVPTPPADSNGSVVTYGPTDDAASQAVFAQLRAQNAALQPQYSSRLVLDNLYEGGVRRELIPAPPKAGGGQSTAVNTNEPQLLNKGDE